MVFYSSYFIHEMLLVCFTFLALGAAWRYWRTRKLGWMLLAGAGVGLMASTKETFVITLAAAAIAVLINQAWNRQLDASGPPGNAPVLNIWHIVAGLITGGVVALLLFSSFFTNASGPIDAIRTYLPWAHRAAGQSPHVHPWYFYLQRLLFFQVGAGPLWTEALIFFLALIGAAAGFRRHKLAGANASLVRFLALYTFLLAAFYSLLAYKTPWCLLTFWHGALLLAGVGAAVLVRSVSKQAPRLVVIGLFLLGGAHLAWEAWRGQTTYAADPRNPYVYAQTSPDVMNLITQLEGLAQADPRDHQLVIKVIAPDQDYWPASLVLAPIQISRLVGACPRRSLRADHDCFRPTAGRVGRKENPFDGWLLPVAPASVHGIVRSTGSLEAMAGAQRQRTFDGAS